MSVPRGQNGSESAVMIVASGPLANNGRLVFAIMIVQPVQSWTVVRSQDEFMTLHTVLPQSPPLPIMDQSNLEVTVSLLQEWLSNALLSQCGEITRPMHDFLIHGANIMPPQYEGVQWTQFVRSSPPTDHHQEENQPVADMDMEDMFDHPDECCTATGCDEDDDDDDIPAPAHERYKPPTHEEITDEDEMELAGEVEMIEDIGSLAQSLGASHLGRSLQLQAEGSVKRQAQNGVQQEQKGLTIGSRQNSKSGGIGSIMERVEQNGGSSFSRPMTAAPPPRLDCFKMLKVIGKGSFGKVFLVRENRTSDVYALKVLRKENIIKRNQVEHTNTERSVLGYVKHRFVVGMNMAFQSRDKLYFVLDYCPGGELFFHLGKEGRFPEARARFYAAEITLAISYIHSLDIIYRDLKPENVLLDANGHIRLTDFGLSKEGISNSSSGANSFCGTPEYLAPEILNRQGHGRAVDWWSLGAVLYEMLTGLPPFYSQDREKLFEKIKKSELHYPGSVSKIAKSLLVGLLAKDPQRRLGSGPQDANDIQTKEFFCNVSFEKLLCDAQNGVPAPWKPPIQGALDTSQFDKEFTRMPIFSPQSMQRHGGAPFGTTPDGGLFKNFTFTDQRIHKQAGTEAGV